MRNDTQPIYLFADSQPLFWKRGESLFLELITQRARRGAPKAAYIGASNGDAPEFYSIFEAAMENAHVRDCRMIRSSFQSDDEAFLSTADIILLAGGNVERGWKVFVETGMKDVLLRRYEKGAILLGISAGAVQLGVCGLAGEEESPGKLLETFGLVPFVVGAHEEQEGWSRLRRTLVLAGSARRGVGIPWGGGMIYKADGKMEAIRHPLHQFSFVGGELRRSLLPPTEP